MTTVIRGTDDSASTPALTGTDADTGVFFPAANTMAMSTGGSERMRVDASGNVGIGTSAIGSTGLCLSNSFNLGWTESAGQSVFNIFRQTSSAASVLANGYRHSATANGFASSISTSFAKTALSLDGGTVRFFTDTAVTTAAGTDVTPTERARITSGGVFLVGTTNTTPSLSQVAGAAIGTTQGRADFAVDGSHALNVGRNIDDGNLVLFHQAGTVEGAISVSGFTVSYNAFSGAHWSQLQEGRGYNPDIPRGTVMSTIGEMCEWKSVEWTETTEHEASPAVEAKEAVLDEEGNVIEPAVDAVEGKDAWTETIPHREAYLGQLPMGATFEEDGFTKTVIDDGNERLPKVKISNVVGDKAVYGVFQTWDDVEDMLVTSLGAFVVRIAAGITVEIGDLLESNGDGCAKVQDDDVIRSKTIAKVTSTNPTATYDDGSYTVPAVIYCG